MEKNWLGLSVQETKRELVDRIGVTPELADDIALRVGRMDGHLRDEFHLFWQEKPFDRYLEISGWTYDKLEKAYGFKPIGCWTTLQWLAEEPEYASHALRRGVK